MSTRLGSLVGDVSKGLKSFRGGGEGVRLRNRKGQLLWHG